MWRAGLGLLRLDDGLEIRNASVTISVDGVNLTEVLAMTNFHKVFHWAALAIACAIVIAATQDVTAQHPDEPKVGHFVQRVDSD